MKIKGAEFKEWYDNHFPEGYFFDSDLEAPPIHDDNGDWALLDDETYETDEFGCLVVDDRENPDGKELTIDQAIRRWRKSRAFDVLVVNVPKERTDEAREALKKLGCTFA